MTNNRFDYSPMQGKNVLITGGLGFIGSNIAQRCVELGANVTILDACIEPYGWNFANISEVEQSVEFIKGDVRDRSLLKELIANKDVVFHMAAQVGREISIESPELDVEVNCTGTINVLEACRRNANGVKVVFAGSRGQIGEPITLPVDESHPQNPTDVYGINKMAAEQYLFLYNKIYDFPVVSLRLNNVYGPRCQMHAGFYGILNWFMANAMTGKPITVYGEGSQTRDYVYITDVVDAFLRTALSENANGQIYFVGSGVETVFLDMVKEIVRAVGKGEIKHVPFPKLRDKIDIKRFVVSYQKINADVGWEPQYDLRTGIDETVRFYSERLGDYLAKREVE
ncbi:SDR family NAD(P)-dependent oxidoreductase [candidate division KSB1 bacterium]|nr:SDR family NAD(P)-dependent oxidoreductase [candidate division KSB1 bacterium]NIR72185.1 SDR family NAD(P)-dependent oxidoreductase [candidate division KSB1 bacterium]NIS26650.1 SDR family NAD(P)-dependent oxidoreductase [candidate division KSB1 bacterium]NIT73418.1 SDR family NAD(P)-dependent oxidoreductase [candidate division KSB1 bacterium]NIU27266.1 SDR family NAD(P)-dependent oxidoreductase [candidate division KSB1 bacterium]